MASTLHSQAALPARLALTTAVVFPGQGSQRPAMALPWAEEPTFTRWADADEILGRDITHLGITADATELREPASCQVALFVHHAVVWDAWRRGGVRPALVAGHSLGEYSALYAAGVLSFPDALRLVDARARATQAAAEASPGRMVACLGCDAEAVAQACAASGAHVANDNAPGQVVVAGSPAALDRLTELLADGPGRVAPLEVGAAYHSPHMAPAVEPFGAALDRTTFADSDVAVVANVDARAHSTGRDWPQLLRAQLTSPVRWADTVRTLAAEGITAVVELGASPVLTGLVKRIDRSLERRFVEAPSDLEGTR